MDIIFATNNKNKIKEIRNIMSPEFNIISLKEAGIDILIQEDGYTFEANALIKSKTVADIVGKPVLADDSGLEIDFLEKAPGVYSSRFLGENTDYIHKNNYILEQLKGVEFKNRTARFICAVALAFPKDEKEPIVEVGTIEGYISEEIKGDNGFGYDPIFFIREYNMNAAEMSMSQKNLISHRGKALRSIKKRLLKNSLI